MGLAEWDQITFVQVLLPRLPPSFSHYFLMVVAPYARLS